MCLEDAVFSLGKTNRSSLRCEGGTVENEGVLVTRTGKGQSCIWSSKNHLNLKCKRGMVSKQGRLLHKFELVSTEHWGNSLEELEPGLAENERFNSTVWHFDPATTEMCIISVSSQHGVRHYKLEIESTKTVMVDCDSI